MFSTDLVFSVCVFSSDLQASCVSGVGRCCQVLYLVILEIDGWLVGCQPVPVWWARAGLVSVGCSAPTDPLVEGNRSSRVLFWGETHFSLGVEMAS